jgi:hypothetical protein
MDIKKNNKGTGIKFSDVKFGVVVEDNDESVYLKTGGYTLLDGEIINAVDLETNFLCYVDPEEIVYPWEKAYICLER